jgi:hypothetical protein
MTLLSVFILGASSEWDLCTLRSIVEIGPLISDVMTSLKELMNNDDYDDNDNNNSILTYM